jgi:hypothetical protein
MDSKILTVKGASYSVGRLSAKNQFHVSRRLGPFLGDIMPNIQSLLKGKGDILDRAIEFVPQIVKTLAAMSNEDCDFILDTCLAVVKFQQETGWVNVVTPNGVIMFSDQIDMLVMLELTAEVVQANLLEFFPIGKLMAYAEAMAAGSLPIS